MTKFEHPLGLTKYEWEAIKACMRAREMVPNGQFLPAFRCAAAHGRMVDRGFMTEVPRSESGLAAPGQQWLVFKMTDENIAAYNAALGAVVLSGPSSNTVVTNDA